MNELLDLVKYFAKFPNRDGVLANFSKTTSTFSEYVALKDYITALPAALIPDIKHFIFSDDNDKLEERVRKIESYFMLIEWGPIVITDPEPSARNRTGDWHFAVNIAHPTDDKGKDAIEYMLLSNKTLALILQLANLIKTDDDEYCSNFRKIESETVIAPLDPYSFSGCVGWSLTFKTNFNNKF